ncbi:MAG: hypothetical protein ACYC42_05865 [Lysobacter sp.]
MTDLILHDIEPTLLDRLKRLADARGCNLEDALLALLDRGLACTTDPDGGLDDTDARVLQEAIVALENVPSDPGFALIGRAVPRVPPASDGPDQAIAAAWTLPK